MCNIIFAAYPFRAGLAYHIKYRYDQKSGNTCIQGRGMSEDVETAEQVYQKSECKQNDDSDNNYPQD